MFETILTLIPKVSQAVLALPEFVKLVKEIGATVHEDDQRVLQEAYSLAMSDSDSANDELAALVASRTA